MLPCTLHLGGPKTGSTSIQDALFFRLRDASFQYASSGQVNGSYALGAIFLDSPTNEQLFRAQGSPGTSFQAYRERLERRLERGVGHAARTGLHLIISAEYIWCQDEAALERLQGWLHERGFIVNARAYMRPWRSWLTSWFLHRVRTGCSEFQFTSTPNERLFDVVSTSKRLRRIFGRDGVTLSKYDPAAFPGNCVVRDFCGSIGMQVPEGMKFRSNEALSDPAARIIYSWHRFGSGLDLTDPYRPARMWRLIDALRELPGPGLRLHPTVLAPWWESLRPQNAWIERELGFSLDEESLAVVDDRAVRCDSEMFEFTPETLDWLARQTGERSIQHRSGLMAARAVAMQADLLSRRPRSPGAIADGLRARLTRRWIHQQDRC